MPHQVQVPLHPGRRGRHRGPAGRGNLGLHGVTPERYEDLLCGTASSVRPPHQSSTTAATWWGCSLGGAKSTPTASSAAVKRPLPASSVSGPGSRRRIMPFPMMAVNDAKAKHYYDNRVRRRTVGCRTVSCTPPTSSSAGKTVVVAACGWCRLRHRPAGQGDGGGGHRHGDRPLQGPGRHHERLPGDRRWRMRPGSRRPVRHLRRLPGRHHRRPLRPDEGQRHPVQCRPLSTWRWTWPGWRGTRLKNSSSGRTSWATAWPTGGCSTSSADGPLVDRSPRATAAPAEIIGMSFAVQALAAESLVKHRDNLEKRALRYPRRD